MLDQGRLRNAIHRFGVFDILFTEPFEHLDRAFFLTQDFVKSSEVLEVFEANSNMILVADLLLCFVTNFDQFFKCGRIDFAQLKPLAQCKREAYACLTGTQLDGVLVVPNLFGQRDFVLPCSCIGFRLLQDDGRIWIFRRRPIISLADRREQKTQKNEHWRTHGFNLSET